MLPTSPRRGLAVALTALAALTCTAATAGAETISYENGVLVDRGQPGENNLVYPSFANGPNNVSGDPVAGPHVVLGADGVQLLGDAATQCQTFIAGETKAACPLPAGGLRVELGDGDDSASLDFTDTPWPAGTSLVVDGGPGKDDLQGGRRSTAVAPVTLLGGDGNDTIKGSEAADTIDGGASNDTIEGYGGKDAIHGGDGDDTLEGDSYYSNPAGDLIDGGAGRDKIDFGWEQQDVDSQPVTVTEDGVANDGRAGEGDDVRSVEVVKIAKGTVTGTDADEELWHRAYEGPVTLDGAGGNDSLLGNDGSADTLIGGPGDDSLAGYGGDDTLIGGPGKDRIDADGSSSCILGPIYGSCTYRAGNDTIDAADGEADSVSCGPGMDTVKADKLDTVSPDCEQVTVTGGDDPTPVTPGPVTGSCKLPKVKGLKPAAAKKKLKRAGCGAYKVTVKKTRTHKVKHGRVLKLAVKGKKVTLYVAR